MKIYLTEAERDRIMRSLTDEQRDFLTKRVRRGMATVFARELAKAKGQHLDDSMSLDELTKALELDWEFLDYRDAGPDWRRGGHKCKCGHTIRYQFIVLNRHTGEVCTFGKNHFETHVELPASVIRDMQKGFKGVDYELDELLMKLRDKWVLPFHIPVGFKMPAEFDEQIRLGVPLLERQIDRLRKAVRDYIHAMRIAEIQSTSKQFHYPPDIERIRNMDRITTNPTQPLLTLSSKPHGLKRISNPSTAPSNMTLDDKQKSFVMQCLSEGIQSVSEICTLMVTQGLASKEQHEKKIIYRLVAAYLFDMRNTGQVQFLGNFDGDVRYRKL